LITYLNEDAGSSAARIRVGLDAGLVQRRLADKERGRRALVQHSVSDHLREVGAPNATPFFLHSLRSNRPL